MPDTPTPTTSNWKATQGFALLTILAFILFAAAGLGWHAGVALARVLGI
jgi:hypothetical protein